MTTQNAAQEGVGIVAVSGTRLRYRIEGHGEPCLVVGSSVYYPRVFSQDLRRHLQLVFVDLRHFIDPQHFLSADPSFSPHLISIDTYADDVERVRQALALGDVIVIGHSVHATVALEYARRYPEHVRGVVAIGGSPSSDGLEAASDRYWEAEASEARKELLTRKRAELTPELRATLSSAALFVREYVAGGPALWYDPIYDASWLWEDVVPDMPVLERLGELFDPYDLAQGPVQISVPVLIAQGRYEFGAPYSFWEEHRHKLPRHKLVVFDRSAHTPPLEEPEQFDQTLVGWLQGLEGSRG